MHVGAIEAGGTKFVCAVADNELNIIEKISIKTSTPEKTFSELFNFFDNYSLKSIGVGSFGPIDINKKSNTYGFITNTPKKEWRNFDFVGTLKERYAIPIAWTTDVNAAGYVEYKLGAAKENNSSIYITVGTGIGGGIIINDKIHEGYSHPEMGHVIVKKHPNDDFKGICPNHKDCLEGLASGTAIEKRMSLKAYELSEEDDFWEIEAYYLAQAIYNYTLVVSPEKIILGGGVMKQNHLFSKIKIHLESLVANYIKLPKFEEYITAPKLKDDAGIMGCLLLAEEAYQNN